MRKILPLLILAIALGAFGQSAIITTGGGGSGSGSVTSVDASAVAPLTVTGGPFTTTGTLVFDWTPCAAHFVLAAPSGATGKPDCRLLVAGDIPAIAPSQVTGTAVITTDSRLSDSRTPTAHASTHAAAGSDPVTVTEAQVTGLVSDLSGKQATGNYVTALTGDGTASGPGSAALTLATVNGAPGTTGDASHVTQLTTDAKGRVTSNSSVAIAIAAGAVSGLAASATSDTTNAANITGGTLAGGRMPALTGDAQSSAGSTATTVKQLHLTQSAITSASSPYTVLAADSVISCDSTGGNVVVNLPAATGSGRVVDVKKLGASNQCSITPLGSDTIDGVNALLAATSANANHWLIDSASGTWITGHRLALGGDVTGTSNSVTVSKVNGVAFAASPSTDTVPVITAANTGTYTAVPACTDTTGNHLNYSTSTHTFLCGTSAATPASISSSSGGTFTVLGPTATRAYTFPDAAATIARLDASQTYSNGVTQTFKDGGSNKNIVIDPTNAAIRLYSSASLCFTSGADASASVDSCVFRLSGGKIASGSGIFAGMSAWAGSEYELRNGVYWGSYDPVMNTGTAWELLTLSTSGTTTATAASIVPANTRILSIEYRITTGIGTATAFTVAVTGGNPFANIGTATTSQTTLTSNTTGTLVANAFADQFNGSTAKTVTVSTTGTPSAGIIRLLVIYQKFTPPTQ